MSLTITLASTLPIGGTSAVGHCTARDYICCRLFLHLGRSVRSAAASAFTVMWTMQTWKQTENFIPNHFTLLMPCSDTMLQKHSVSDDEDVNACVHTDTDLGCDEASTSQAQ